MNTNSSSTRNLNATLCLTTLHILYLTLWKFLAHAVSCILQWQTRKIAKCNTSNNAESMWKIVCEREWTTKSIIQLLLLCEFYNCCWYKSNENFYKANEIIKLWKAFIVVLWLGHCGCFYGIFHLRLLHIQLKIKFKFLPPFSD
jgi:hypothetical protein